MTVETQEAGKKPWEVAFERDHAEKVPVAEEKEVVEEKEPVKPEEVKETPKEEPVENQPDESEAEPVEDKPVEDKPVPDDSKDKTPSPELPPVTDEYVSSYALKKGITTGDAREEIERNRAILSKYKSPEELAEAYRHTQSAYDKLKVEREKRSTQQEAAVIMANPRAYVQEKITQNADKLINEYRQMYPKKSEMLSDEVILEELTEKATNQIEGQLREQQLVIKQQAISKREELISSLSDADRQFLPDIKAVLNNLPDNQVISDTFKFKDLIQWARGDERNWSKAIKEAEERGRKSAEKPQIVGEVGKSSSATKVNSKKVTSSSSSLSDYDKTRAKAMFANAVMTDDERYDAYIEVTQRKK